LAICLLCAVIYLESAECAGAAKILARRRRAEQNFARTWRAASAPGDGPFTGPTRLSPYFVVSHCLNNVSVDLCTFLDLGCGKGRALLVASELPFRDIMGVELFGTPRCDRPP
jgi:hypothetical protein